MMQEETEINAELRHETYTNRSVIEDSALA